MGAKAREDRGLNGLLRGVPATSVRTEVGDATILLGPLRHHARRRHAPASRDRPEVDRGDRAPAEPAPLRSRAPPRHAGIRNPPAARQRHHGERRGRSSRASMPDAPASTSTRPRSPTRTRTSSARGSSPGRASTTSTPSWQRWKAASPRTRSSRTTCSRDPRADRARLGHRGRRRFPLERVLAHAGRQRRWVRGDWQILAWLFPWVPTRRGLERNRLPLIARWKILDNLRRSLVPPGTLALLISAWTWLPGSTWAWTLAVYLGMAFPIYSKIARGLKDRRRSSRSPSSSATCARS